MNLRMLTVDDSSVIRILLQVLFVLPLAAEWSKYDKKDINC